MVTQVMYVYKVMYIHTLKLLLCMYILGTGQSDMLYCSYMHAGVPCRKLYPQMVRYVWHIHLYASKSQHTLDMFL